MSTDIETTIRRHLQANDSIQETIGWSEIVGRFEVATPILRLDAEVSTPQKLAPIQTRRIGGWVAVAAAVTTLVLFGMLPLLSGNDGTPSPVAIVPTPATTVAESVVTVPTSIQWNATLAQAKARQAPPVATCPPGSSPDTLGPADQQRPWGASWSNQAAVFDVHAGRIIFIDEIGETWTFDVCTNTWDRANPILVPADPRLWYELGPTVLSGQLVYDVDSDVTIAFHNDGVAVYDANTNTWTRRHGPSDYPVPRPAGLGAVYDPVSGLVVLQTTENGLVAYDVDTDTWTEIGRIQDLSQEYLIGYSTETDQFAFLGGFERDGALVDVRSGEPTYLSAPIGGVGGGFGRLGYATSTATPVVEGEGICRLDPAKLDWTCIDLADGPDSDTAGLLASIVGDPINDRIVLIYGYGAGWNGERFYDVNDIWAIDFQTYQWTQLLSATRMTHEEQ